MTREELEFEMVSLAKNFVSQRRVGEAGLKVMVRMMIDKVIESKLHQPTVISSVCEPHGCINYSQGYDRCEKQCSKCKDL